MKRLVLIVMLASCGGSVGSNPMPDAGDKGPPGTGWVAPDSGPPSTTMCGIDVGPSVASAVLNLSQDFRNKPSYGDVDGGAEWCDAGGPGLQEAIRELPRIGERP